MKKDKILDVAEILFAEKGFEGTSIRDIAQMADVNIAMISYYFGSKEKLLAALIADRSAHSTDYLEELSHASNLDTWTRIDRMVDHYVDRLFTNHRFHNIISRQIILDLELADQINTFKLRNLDIIRRIISEGVRNKTFRKVDTELTVATLIGTVSQATMSKSFFSKALGMDPSLEMKDYFNEISPRLKKHLKSLFRSHLDIKNA